MTRRILARLAGVALLVLAAAPGGGRRRRRRRRGPVTNLPLPRFVSMRADTANARRGPTLDQRVDWEFVRRGLPLEVRAEYGQWRRVRDAEGYGGWVHHTLLSGVRTALVPGEAPVPLRAGPEEGAPVRAMAEPGVVGRLEACRGAWCEIDGRRRRGLAAAGGALGRRAGRGPGRLTAAGFQRGAAASAGRPVEAMAWGRRLAGSRLGLSTCGHMGNSLILAEPLPDIYRMFTIDTGAPASAVAVNRREEGSGGRGGGGGGGGGRPTGASVTGVSCGL